MQTLSRFIQLSLPFWGNKKQWLAWLLLALVIAFSLAIIQVSVWITEWHKLFYDAIAEFNGAVIPQLILTFIGYIVLIVSFIVCGNWLRKRLIFRWREHLTQQLQHTWLMEQRHYFLQIQNDIDNPDQRISEDIALLTTQSIDLFKYFIMNIAKLVAFISILWQLSGVQSLQIGNYSFNIYGYLVWIALIYSIICTLVMHKIGYKLQQLNVQRQHKEADYRRSLVQITENSSQIAAYRGELQEIQRLTKFFQQIKQNWFELINREFKVEIFSATYLRVSLFIPIFATLPMYLARTITFGDMMQARSAFGNVQDGFGWFMDYYKSLIQWAATIERLFKLQQSLQQLSALSLQRESLDESQNERLKATNIQVYTPLGEKMLENINLKLQKQQWCLLDGVSGVGKSSLLKTLAGLWQYSQGQVQFCNQYLFIPQKPYIMSGRLREVISYPLAPIQDDPLLIECLTQVGLAHLVQQLDQPQQWQNILSGGEQQRIGIARVLLFRPKLLLLDEATNQLDDEAALSLMLLLKQKLPDSACLMVSHQSLIKQLCSTQYLLG